MSLANRFKNLFNFCPYIIFVADAADIVRGAKLFIWSNFASHENCWWPKFHITSKLAPHENCLSCGVIWLCGSTTNCSLYQTLLNVTNLQCMLSWRDLRCFGAKSILSRFTYFCVEQKWTLLDFFKLTPGWCLVDWTLLIFEEKKYFCGTP